MAVLTQLIITHENDPPAIITVNFNDPGNKRISTVEWSNPAGFMVRIQIWVDGVLRIDRQERSTSGSENIPGNYQAVFDAGMGAYVLPPNIEYAYFVSDG